MPFLWGICDLTLLNQPDVLSVIKALRWLIHLGATVCAQWENRQHATGIFGHYENYRCHVVLNENKYTTLSRERQMKMCRLKVPGWHSPAVPNCNYGHSFPSVLSKDWSMLFNAGRKYWKKKCRLVDKSLTCVPWNSK